MRGIEKNLQTLFQVQINKARFWYNRSFKKEFKTLKKQSTILGVRTNKDIKGTVEKKILLKENQEI